MSAPRALPIDQKLGEIRELLEGERVVIVEAPPGTGKTTRVPPSILGTSWLGDQRVLLLEPRRVAARAAAARIAAETGSSVGDVVGLRTRFDTSVGKDTKLEVVTEGVLTRMLISDPSLDGIGAIVFDEFHERSIHADTALAFTRETMSALRDDLRIVLMSATVDAERMAEQLGTTAVVSVEAEVHPVTTIYRAPGPGRTVDDEVPDAVIDALRAYEGDLLVFMAGAGAINAAARALQPRLPAGVVVTPLHGSLDAAAQDRALLPDERGRRKVVLATPIAETSVTIDGVRVVIDTGRRRRPEHDVGRGMSRLRTVSASRAATDQRRGRAGRQAPGFCIRLWPEADQARRRPDEPAEILTADLTSLAIDIAAWGAVEVAEIPWLDEPPATSLAAARGVLTRLGALDDDRRLTDHGRRMSTLGTEPRLAHLLLKGQELDMAATACDLAALLGDRDIFRGRHRPTDLRTRLDALRSDSGNVDDAVRRRVREVANRWRRQLKAGKGPADPENAGLLVSLAFPERVAQRRSEPGSFLLASGAGSRVDAADELAQESYLAVAETDGMGADARIVLAAPIERGTLEAHHPETIETRVRGEWDRRKRDVVFERQERLGALVLRREPDDRPDRAAVVEALLAGVRREGLTILKWTDADNRRRDRLEFLHTLDPETWPTFADDTLVDEIETWLAPQLSSANRRADLEALDVSRALDTRIDWRQSRELDRLAPTHVTVPSGSRIPIDYSAPDAPTIAVRLQEMFGLTATPVIGGGRVPLVVQLLSPAHRPVQVTSDLASFWEDGYQAVRRELRGRYPKHEWPEDPTTAPPTRRAKRRKS